MNNLPPLEDIFPFKYSGGGYLRGKDVPQGESAEILHGMKAIEFLYEKIKEHNND